MHRSIRRQSLTGKGVPDPWPGSSRGELALLALLLGSQKCPCVVTCPSLNRARIRLPDEALCQTDVSC